MSSTPAPARPDFTALKEKHRAVWASGEYDRIARGIVSVADHVTRVARIRADERVLDVACGTGNTALAARARGAKVAAIDLTPEMLDVSRRRAAEEGWSDIEWKQGDAEAIPFQDASFDVVVSSCGLMFAPDQQQVADEVARVTRPGGRIAIQAWTREGGVGRMFDITAKYLPPPPGVPSPFVWGDPERVKQLFGSRFRDWGFERYDCPEFADTPEQIAELFLDRYGPTYRAYRSVPPARASAFRDDLIDLYRGYVSPADGKVRWGREYVIALARRA